MYSFTFLRRNSSIYHYWSERYIFVDYHVAGIHFDNGPSCYSFTITSCDKEEKRVLRKKWRHYYVIILCIIVYKIYFQHWSRCNVAMQSIAMQCYTLISVTRTYIICVRAYKTSISCNYLIVRSIYRVWGASGNQCDKRIVSRHTSIYFYGKWKTVKKVCYKEDFLRLYFLIKINDYIQILCHICY